MKLRIAENFRAVFYAPFYAIRPLGLAARERLEDAGVNTTTLRTTENLTMSQQLEALAAGKLDVVQLFEPYASQALADGNAILYAASSRGPTCYTTFICSRDGAAKRREEFIAL